MVQGMPLLLAVCGVVMCEGALEGGVDDVDWKFVLLCRFRYESPKLTLD
jgi:hypothetical protein